MHSPAYFNAVANDAHDFAVQAKEYGVPEIVCRKLRMTAISLSSAAGVIEDRNKELRKKR